jgi:DNA-binding CsgD family transcriptional regulator
MDQLSNRSKTPAARAAPRASPAIGRGDRAAGDRRVSSFGLAGERYCVVSVGLVPPAAGQLTEAERAVASLVASGLTNAEIARERGTALRTVANQVASILEKLGAASRAEIARSAARWADPAAPRRRGKAR